MTSRVRRWARREWRLFCHHMVPHRVLMRAVFGVRDWPTPQRLLESVLDRVFGRAHGATIRRDPDTGTITARGARYDADGWQVTASRRRRVYRDEP